MKLIKKFSDFSQKALVAGMTVDKIIAIPARERFIRSKYEETIDSELDAIDKDFDIQFKELGV